MRTEAEILAQLEARYAEMKAEADRRAKDPALLFPCETCKWAGSHSGYAMKVCTQPLVKGFDDRVYPARDNAREWPTLCGPEKALWEARGSFAQWWADNHDTWWFAIPFGMLAGLMIAAAIVGTIYAIVT